MSEEEEETPEVHQENSEEEEMEKLDTILKKYPKTIKIGDITKGIEGLRKELLEFLAFCRNSVDKTFANVETLEQASRDLERSFQILLTKRDDIEPISFISGIVFGLSRWSFLESKLLKKASEKKGDYVV